ncbi:MAG: glycosyltransferase [Pirellulaceae bacterium]
MLDERIRVAFVITELEVGGAERCLASVATRLDRQRFDPAVFCLAPRPAETELVERLESSDIDVHFLGARSAWQCFSARVQFRKLLASWRPHIVQSFLFHANVLAASVVRRGAGPSLVLGVRVADPARWRAAVERMAARRAQRVVCVSESVAEFAQCRVGVPAEKIVVIPNGIDMSEYGSSAPADLQPLGVGNQRRIIVTIGRLHHQKGLDLLLRRMPVAFESLPNHDLLIVGDGPMLADLKRLTATLGLVGRVHFAGRRKDVPCILARCEILVLLSRWEGMPNVLLEAMAAGRPVIVNEAEGVAEVLGPLARLQMVPISDASDFVDRLVRIVSRPEDASALGRENRDRVASCFDIRSMVERYERLYDQLAAP